MTSGAAVSSAGGIFAPLHRDSAGTLGVQPCWRHAAVRDLAWLLLSAPLLSAVSCAACLGDPLQATVFGGNAAQSVTTLLQQLDADPQAFQDALAAHAERRLGRYAERLLAAWLTRAPDVTVHALNLPVRTDKGVKTSSEGVLAAGVGRTLGECDALFETGTGAREHWEMAVKFYLYVDDELGGLCEDGAPVARMPAVAASSLARSGKDRLPRPAASAASADLFAGCDAFVGAGLTDRFDWKLRRLIEHQLPLSDRPELLALMPGPWHARMFVKGRLFYPLAQWRALPAPAMALSSNHERGWWATLDTWLALSQTVDGVGVVDGDANGDVRAADAGAADCAALGNRCTWTILSRLEWLAPLQPADDRIIATAAFAKAVIAYFDVDAPTAMVPLQVAAFRMGTDTATAYELSRGFIVPNTWPAKALAFRHHY